jgi:hypothetical protein
LVCLFAALLQAPSSAQNLIGNGGFEEPMTAPSGILPIYPSSNYPQFAWQVQAGNVEIFRQGYSNGIYVFNGPPHSGLQVLDLDGVNPGVISQTIATTTGRQYMLTFAYANNPYLQFVGPAQAEVSIRDVTSGADVATPYVIAHDSSSATAYDWTLSSVTFTAISASTEVKFRSLNPSSSTSGILLDSVAVTDIAGQVVAFCPGDGSSSTCPCLNFGATGHGCGNSANAAGALLTWSGIASVAFDTFTLHGAGMPPTSTGLYFQGTAQLGMPAGIALGDGLRCVGGNVRRLGVRPSSAGTSSFGVLAGDGSIAALAGISASGGTYYYQLWYRDSETYCVAAKFNFTNALAVTWGP